MGQLSLLRGISCYFVSVLAMVLTLTCHSSSTSQALPTWASLSPAQVPCMQGVTGCSMRVCTHDTPNLFALSSLNIEILQEGIIFGLSTHDHNILMPACKLCLLMSVMEQSV